jgi:hypothetical protein
MTPLRSNRGNEGYPRPQPLPLDQPVDLTLVRFDVRPSEYEEIDEGHLGDTMTAAGCPLTSSVMFPTTRTPKFV